MGTITEYQYKNNVYKYLGVGRFKDSTDQWVDAVMYERDNHVYMREIKDFFKKFELVNSYCDKGILNSIADLIDPKYEPAEEKNKNQISNN